MVTFFSLAFLLLFPFIVNSSISFEDAKTLYSQGEYGEVQKFYQGASVYNKKAFLELACLHKERKQYEKSIFYLKEYLKNDNDEDVRLLLSEVLYLDGNSREALTVLNRLVKRSKNHIIYVYIGLAYEDLGKYPLALKAYKKSLEYRTNTIALYRSGKIYLGMKDYDEAIKFFEKLIKLDASMRIAYYHLGAAYLNKKDFIKAYKYLSRAIKFYPKDKELKSALLSVKKSLGEDYFLKQKAKSLTKRKEIKLSAYKKVQGNIPVVRVGVLRKVKSISFKCFADIKLKENVFLKKERLYRVEPAGKNQVYVSDYESKKKIAALNMPLILSSSNKPFYIIEVTYGSDQFWHKSIDMALRGNLEIIGSGGLLTLVNIINLEEYLYGVLPGEIYPSAQTDALKSQAVAARTIAIKNMGRHKKEGFDFCSDVHCQVYRGLSKESERTNKAVDSTRGEIIVFDNRPVETFYHSNCGGCLRDDLFDKRKYLNNKLDRIEDNYPVFSPWEAENWFKSSPSSFSSQTKRISNYRWQRIYDDDDFMIIFGWPLKDFRDITIIKKGECEHIDILQIERGNVKEKVSGDLKIRRYFDNLRSSAFKTEIKYRRGKGINSAERIIIWGAGFGHGVGLSQEGMEAMAKGGFGYREILRHYYKNIDIKDIY